MDLPYLKWREKDLQGGLGVLVASDAKAEIFLPWWYANYSAYNAFPITFVDFGMTEKGRQWCEKRGEVIPLDIPKDLLAKRVLPKAEGILEAKLAGFRHKQPVWFKKPFAFLLTPYESTVWLDLDCQVKVNLEPLFALSREGIGLSLLPKPAPFKSGDKYWYNSGVVSYTAGNLIIKRWVEATVNMQGWFIGDEDILSRVINEMKAPVVELPIIYNWLVEHLGEDPRAAIVHWNGSVKERIIEQIRSHLEFTL